MIDIQEKKNKIISFLETNGPSLPVRIAKTIQMDPVFASAILSELLGTKQVKTSHMKIGSSPLYLLPGQEQKLEEHTENLKSIENEAYQKIKENKILKDEDEEPAIRVALRNIKDFAIPFKFQEKIMWKHAFTPEEEIQKLISMPEEKTPIEDNLVVKDTPVPKAWEVKKEEIKRAKALSEVLVPGVKRPITPDVKNVSERAKEESKRIESIFTEKEKPKAQKKKTFLEQVEEFLEYKNTKIISIEEVDKKKVVAKTESESETALLFAFNKKKITEDELMKCYKKAKASNLPYHIIILGDLTKKMNNTIDAYKKLLKVEKLNTLVTKDL